MEASRPPIGTAIWRRHDGRDAPMPGGASSMSSLVRYQPLDTNFSSRRVARMRLVVDGTSYLNKVEVADHWSAWLEEKRLD